jgi:hypothetical protein
LVREKPIFTVQVSPKEDFNPGEEDADIVTIQLALEF